MDILFSIVSHGQKELVEDLISSLDQYLDIGANNFKLIITENLYCDVDFKSQKFSIDVIYNVRPKGFGDNHNSAFEKNKSDYFFIINPDIRFFEKCEIDQVLSFLEQEKIDLASPKIISPSGSMEDYKRADLTFLNLFKRRILKQKDEKFDWFAGMFLVMKSSSFRKLQGFDTDFFMYVEDCDLNMRARKAGMRICDIKNLCVIHNAQRASARNLNHLKWHISSLLKYWLFR